MKSIARRSILDAPRPTVIPPPPFHPSGKRIINLTLGDPARVDPKAFSTPGHIREARQGVVRTNDGGLLAYNGQYAPPRGVQKLLELLARIEGLPETDLAITMSASEGIAQLAFALAGEMAMPDPTFPPYLEQMLYNGRRLDFYQALERLDAAEIEANIHDDTVAILVVNPSNPTGRVYYEDELRLIIDIAKRHRLIIAADEVYNALTFGKRPLRIKDLTTEVPILQIGSFSKEYVMCGDKVGWLGFYNVDDKLAQLRDALFRLSATRLSASFPGQLAAIAALEGGTAHIEPMMHEVQLRLAAFVEGLSRIEGVKIINPEAGFYLWFGLERKGLRFENDVALVRALAEQQAVYMLPGSGFSRISANDQEHMWFRAVFLSPAEELIEGAKRFEDFLAQVRA